MSHAKPHGGAPLRPTLPEYPEGGAASSRAPATRRAFLSWNIIEPSCVWLPWKKADRERAEIAIGRAVLTRKKVRQSSKSVEEIVQRSEKLLRRTRPVLPHKT